MARHHAMGGVKIDVKARVLDRHGKVFPDPYAVGGNCKNGNPLTSKALRSKVF